MYCIIYLNPQLSGIAQDVCSSCKYFFVEISFGGTDYYNNPNATLVLKKHHSRRMDCSVHIGGRGCCNSNFNH